MSLRRGSWHLHRMTGLSLAGCSQRRIILFSPRGCCLTLNSTYPALVKAGSRSQMQPSHPATWLASQLPASWVQTVCLLANCPQCGSMSVLCGTTIRSWTHSRFRVFWALVFLLIVHLGVSRCFCPRTGTSLFSEFFADI